MRSNCSTLSVIAVAGVCKCARDWHHRIPRDETFPTIYDTTRLLAELCHWRTVAPPHALLATRRTSSSVSLWRHALAERHWHRRIARDEICPAMCDTPGLNVRLNGSHALMLRSISLAKNCQINGWWGLLCQLPQVLVIVKCKWMLSVKNTAFKLFGYFKLCVWQLHLTR